jgi:hypothetical protein
VSVVAHRRRNVELGPLFASGVLLFGYGLLRRRVFAVLAGLAAIWLDQRSELRSLRERAKTRYLTAQFVRDDGDQSRSDA